MIRLSIILPCYNVENYIGACLDSLFRQDIPISEYEVICVNDCSTDNTKQVILDYIQKYPTIHLINHEINQTVGGARNTGLAAAQGSYVWFVDPDDMIVDNTLRELLNRAERNNLDIALFNFYATKEFSGNRIVTNRNYTNSKICSGCDFLQTYFDYQIDKNTIVWLQLYKRTFLLNNHIRFPEIRISEDALFSWKAFLYAKRVESESTERYIYRQNNSQTKRLKNTAVFLQSQSVLFPIELLTWLQQTRLPNRFEKKVYCTARHFASILFGEYRELESSEKERMYEIIRTEKRINALMPLLGKKNRLLLQTRFLGFSLFNRLVDIFAR